MSDIDELDEFDGMLRADLDPATASRRRGAARARAKKRGGGFVGLPLWRQQTKRGKGSGAAITLSDGEDT